MIRSVFLFVVVILITSCAKLPIESITLTDAIIDEGNRMHQLNISLINKMFKEKREKIDAFIRNDYTPKVIEEFQARVPPGTDYEEEFTAMLQSIVPRINTRRDIMQGALEDQRIKLITKLDEDFQAFEEASYKLRGLIESGVKVNEERRLAFEKISNLTRNKIDLNQIESELDNFILKSRDIGGDINELNNAINSLINN